MTLVVRLGSWLLWLTNVLTESESSHMLTVRIVVRPSGLINGHDWPKVGETVDLPDVVAQDMASAGHVEIVQPEKVEKRPAARKGVETRKG